MWATNTAEARSLPRPRGDGPHLWAVDRNISKSPPPTRGWSPDPADLPRRARVSPAHAGMVRRHSSPGRARTRLPRPRGDGPLKPDGRTGTPPSPPPTRGWSVAVESVEPARDVSPAHAGMVLIHGGFRRAGVRLPRPRGDGPDRERMAGAPVGSPPPTRGWSHVAERELLDRLVSPAHAGMVLRHRSAALAGHRLPRPRGDGPVMVCRAYGTAPSPPPTRGWSPVLGERETAEDVSPAHAGMVRGSRTRPRRQSRLPRPRGDGPAITTVVATASPSPPPTRGWSLGGRMEGYEAAVSPAHAGMVLTATGTRAATPSLPRLRGDGPLVEAGGEARAIGRGAGGVILEHALAAGGVQGVELPVEDLAAFGGGDAGVADEAHGMMCGVRSRKTPLRCILSQRDYFWVVGDIFRRNAGRGTYLVDVTTNVGDRPNGATHVRVNGATHGC